MTTPMMTVGDMLDATNDKARALDTDASRARVRALLEHVAAFSRPCKVCGAPLWFVRTSAAQLMPYTDNATPHWADCPGADELRRRRARQATLPGCYAADRAPVDR